MSARDPDGSADVEGLCGDVHLLRRGERPLVVLVHGFANSEDVARRSYERFLSRLAEELSPDLGGRAEVVALHWPGDHPLRLLNVPTFSVRVPAANDTGRLLGDMLAKSSRPRVILVAHSLGSRVVMSAFARLRFLEARRRLADREAREPSGHREGRGRRMRLGPPPVDAVLLAAAVPVWQCEGTARFARQPRNSTTTVLHSLRDLVLMLAFPPGQKGVDRWGEAVGRRGRPAEGRWVRRVPTDLGHSGYWDDPEVARQIARVVRVTPAPGAVVAPRPAPQPRSRGPLPSLDPATRPPLPGRTLR